MTPAPEPRQIHARPRHEYVSVREAATRLGTSESDIRRKIKAGALVAESLPRPGGTYLRVRLDAPEAAPEAHQAAPDDGSELAIAAPDPRQAPPEARQDVPAIVSAAVAPYVALNERIAELYAGAMAENRELAERAVRAETDARAASSRVSVAETHAANVEHDRSRIWGLLLDTQREHDAARADLAAERDAATARATAAEQRAAELERRRWWRWW